MSKGKPIKKFFSVLFLILKGILSIIPMLFIFIKEMFYFFIMIFKSIFKSTKRLFRFSITFKMTIFYSFMFFIILLISSLIIISSFTFFLYENLKGDLIKSYNYIVNDVKIDNSIDIKYIKNISTLEESNISIYNNQNEIYYSTTTDTPIDLNYYTESPKLNYDRSYLTIGLNRKINFNNTTYNLVIEKNLEIYEFYVQNLAIILLIIILLSIIITIVLGSKTSKKMLLPIKNMTKTAKDISANALDTRLDVGKSHDELKELAETFNEMLDRIQTSYVRQEQFVSDASHELRTPISVVQGYANLLNRWGKDDQAVLDEALNAIKSESENMQDLTEKLLFLARSDKNLQKIEKESFNLTELIEEIVKETKLIDKNHNIISDIKENLNIYADKKLLKQSIRIFIDNSTKFTPEKGTIKITANKNRALTTITIEDTGMGIPKEDIPYIFDRFYRADKSRAKKSGGTGLGLSIAKWIIDNHGGNIKVESEIDNGTKITITLPQK